MRKVDLLLMLEDLPLNAEIDFEVEDGRYHVREYVDEIFIANKDSNSIMFKIIV